VHSAGTPLGRFGISTLVNSDPFMASMPWQD
jgi:hypothetical protein